MVEEAIRPERQPTPRPRTDNEEDAKQPATPSWFGRFLNSKLLVLLLGTVVLFNGIGFAFFLVVANGQQRDASSEVSLGRFYFQSRHSESGQVVGAEFSLHIALLQQVERGAREQLATHKYRVQQDIETLLRRAHSGDFDDPLLAGLKQQLQERINKSLGFRVIAEVIITDMKTERSLRKGATITESTDSLPWVDQPSG